MLLMWRLHETAQVPHRVGKVRPGVHQIPESTNDPPILRGVDDWSDTLLAQLEAGLHGRQGRVAVLHPAALQELVGVSGLTERDAAVALVDLDTEIVGEKTKV